jgi:hypothetical protein
MLKGVPKSWRPKISQHGMWKIRNLSLKLRQISRTSFFFIFQRIFDSGDLDESFKSLEIFIDSSKRYFIDDQELKETKKLAISYLSSRTLLHTLKAITETTDKKKKCKKIKDVLQKVPERAKMKRNELNYYEFIKYKNTER